MAGKSGKVDMNGSILLFHLKISKFQVNIFKFSLGSEYLHILNNKINLPGLVLQQNDSMITKKKID